MAAASYEARRFGVRSAMPSVIAKRRCPDLVFVPPRFEVYKAVSAATHAVFHQHGAVGKKGDLPILAWDVHEAA